ncbi:hypothetical protein DEJ28_02420 [Curtobacterium sp. MCPF17_002]|uniref:hypothetical protein n=1 Tax=Curtobacterium sp. MCPF17_002 TaxID=2175645 RepID=UPI0015E8CF9F|nr:hypothetical protein [Curtobacterium sp. MCPF17_002]WIB77972.1 hypothetical protein DEJ28_02420 [Curtobacterium sp. MCPF17_002]
MSTYERDESVAPARIPTIARARKQWRRSGVAGFTRTELDFFRDETPEAVQR